MVKCDISESEFDFWYIRLLGTHFHDMIEMITLKVNMAEVKIWQLVIKNCGNY